MNRARPTKESINNSLIRKVKKEINCVKIGTIISFDPATQLASVQISIKQVVGQDEDGADIIKEYPVLQKCPVITLFGGVDVLTMPIQSGDSCLVFFCDRDIDRWINSGGGIPQTSRLHDLSDAIALVGIRPLTNSISNYLANGIRLSHGLGDSQIDLKDGLIESIASLFLHNGDAQITGNLTVNGNFTVEGTTFGNGGTWTIDANIQQTAGNTMSVGNGATGTFDVVIVENGIVIGGS